MYRIVGKFGRGKFPSKNAFARNIARTATCKNQTRFPDSYKIPTRSCRNARKGPFLAILAI